MKKTLDTLYKEYRIVRFFRAMQQLFQFPFFLSRTQKGTPLYDKGFDIRQAFFSPEECDRIVVDFDQAFQERLPAPETDAYIVSRKHSAISQFDKNVFQLMNYQGINPALKETCEARILEAFREQLGLDLCVASYTVQLDMPDTETKRPFHVDGYGINYKLFVYLSDVKEMADGPYTVIPASHRHIWRKWANLFLNLVTGNSTSDDMRYLYKDGESFSVLGDKGTAILSCQSLAHKGWQDHTGRRRYVLVVYLRAAERAGERFVLGRELAITEPMKLY
ncbi:hypothetical protein [Sneathiella chinensis]|uniref:Phytanoyl-CoA dioxygenase n=1 Tax=Sneathiella chinensis TaxID=349750 RepID=A0ABQ5U0U2_9PROT|nr:hypothetical protein [Sneathiella chinensis]GLQ05775.1 hypothetical protein GCM10007924_09960 [Sneathiella chinensis]